MWMTSKGHRRNMLDPRFGHYGLASAEDGQGRKYWALVLGRSLRPIPTFCRLWQSQPSKCRNRTDTSAWENRRNAAGRVTLERNGLAVPLTATRTAADALLSPCVPATR